MFICWVYNETCNFVTKYYSGNLFICPLLTERTELKVRPPSKVEVPALHTAFNLSAFAVSDSSTPVSYEWTKDDRRLWNDGTRVRITQGADGEALLEIVDIEESDYGRYRCRATNGISYDDAVTDVTGPTVPIPR